ncbi:MAG TPA: DUF819 family protein, partial [Candidatus Polarisedimenticolia bacterium]|nr:DUF819 family protein [Candidatus Polarisedimenticolia bacterium]
MAGEPLIQDPLGVLCVLAAVLAGLFTLDRHARLGRIFKVVPLIVFAYFVPAALSNFGLIPIQAPLYETIKDWLLPASLILLTLSVDIPAILRLGPIALVLFFAATTSIVLGGPLAYLLLGWLVPAEMGEEAWKGLAALSGSWIGGGANFVAIGRGVGIQDATLGMMVVVDVAVANVWMAVLFFFAGREKSMDESLGADRTQIDALRLKVERLQASIARHTGLPDLLQIVAISLGGTAVATAIARRLPEIGDIISRFTWVVMLVTVIGVGLSFTRVRGLEGAGASRVGSLFLYLLIASIGAHADFRKLAGAPAMVAVGARWMAFHAATMLLVRRRMKAPIFFA